MIVNFPMNLFVIKSQVQSDYCLWEKPLKIQWIICIQDIVIIDKKNVGCILRKQGGITPQKVTELTWESKKVHV